MERQDEWLSLRPDDLPTDCSAEEVCTGDPPRCPLCNAPVYSLRFIRRLPGIVTFAWQCPTCSIGGLISVTTTPQTPCELTSSERVALAGVPPIDEADVQRIRQLLHIHRGDLRDLL